MLREAIGVRIPMEVKVYDPYLEYRKTGGRFSPADYKSAMDVLCNGNGPNLDSRSPEYHQITGIAARCGIPLSQQEITVYTHLRPAMATEEQLGKPPPDGTEPVWKMSDQHLAREIILASEGKGNRFQKITDNYPHIFPPDTEQG